MCCFQIMKIKQVIIQLIIVRKQNIILNQMGNSFCCEQQPRKQFIDNHTVTVIHKQEPIRVPELHPTVRQHLQRERPFFNQLLPTPTVKQFGNDIYEGRVDQKGRPSGFGRMYHKNGSVFIGEFVNGVASGQGHYIKTDGSYYHGRMSNNMANDQNGIFWSPKFQYKGGILNNEIHGKGQETGENHFFQGTYNNGKKQHGILKWTDGSNKFIYEGSLNNQGQFDGKGKLEQLGKGTYTGDFVNGNKHGRGKFQFQSGITYIGEYYHNLKDGIGKIISKDGHTAYDGQFKNGLPHGKGKAPTNLGQLKQRHWVDGIDKLMLSE